MAVLSGAILTFGRDALGLPQAGLLACAPLLIWYWATYETLDRYGVTIEGRLAKLDLDLGFRLYFPVFVDRFAPKSPESRKAKASGRLVAVADDSTVAEMRNVLQSAMDAKPGAFHKWWIVAFGVSLVVGFSVGLTAFLSPPWLAVGVGVLCLGVCLVQRFRDELQVRLTMRICGALLHGVLALLIGTALRTNAPEVPQQASGTSSLEVQSRGLAMSMKTSSESIVVGVVRALVTGIEPVEKRAAQKSVATPSAIPPSSSPAVGGSDGS